MCQYASQYARMVQLIGTFVGWDCLLYLSDFFTVGRLLSQRSGSVAERVFTEVCEM